MALTSPPIAVAPFDKGKLAAGITATATTITVSPIYKTVDGARTKQGFNTTSGIALISSGDFVERISFQGSSVDSTTKVTTLTTVTRGLSVTSTTASFTGGTGKAWPKGAKIVVVADASYFQSGVFKNVANTFTADQTFQGAVTVDSTTKTLSPPQMTTTQRNALASPRGIIENLTTNTFQQYLSGAWSDIGDTGTATATESSEGKVELATVAEHDSSTTGARVIQAKNVVQTTAGAGDAKKVQVLDSAGLIPAANLGTGSSITTKYLRGDQTWQTVTVASTDYVKVLSVSTSTSSNAGTSSTSEANLGTNYSVASAVWGVGTVLRLRCGGKFDVGAGTLIFKVKLGTTAIWTSPTFSPTVASNQAWKIDCDLICRVTGAGGTVLPNCSLIAGDNKVYTSTTPLAVSVDLSTSQTLQVSIQFGTSDGTNAVDCRSFVVESLSTTPS